MLIKIQKSEKTPMPIFPIETTNSFTCFLFNHYNHNKSNRLSLMFIQISITSNIKFALPKTDNVKEFMKFVEERSQTAN